LVEAVQAALQGREVPKLKQANEALDAATQSLAALVIQKAMADAESGRALTGPGKP
jgi:hypothetical protein